MNNEISVVLCSIISLTGSLSTIIGASLSEPHIDEKYMRESYIYIYIYMWYVRHARRLIQNL